MDAVTICAVLDNMITCGVNNSNIFYRKLSEQWIDGDILSGMFEMCTEKYFEELDQEFK